MVDIPHAKFKLGRVVGTPAALEAITDSGESIWTFLARHLACDWGDLDAEDKRLNDEALENGSRLLSAYQTAKGVKLWVITEAADDRGNRASTCILTPDEY
jgi:hypothetical protein